jgi:hypothetical protein
MSNLPKFCKRKSWFLIMTLTFLLLFNCRIGLTSNNYQDESKASPDFTFTCIQNEKEFILKTKISYWTGERDLMVGGAMVVFTNQISDESRILTTIPTDMNGEAEFRIAKKSDKLINEEGNFTFGSIFEGNQDYESAEDYTMLRSLNMHMDFLELESDKKIVVEAYEIDQNGDRIPLDAMDIYFFVPRSFSLLPVGDGWFENGSAQANFPTTLPGDSLGNLTIVAKIEDHELYGNVEVVAVKEWGLARPPVIIQKRRGLGDTDAPLWMVYTLLILLSAVWFHYLYVFYLMIKIKRLRRN